MKEVKHYMDSLERQPEKIEEARKLMCDTIKHMKEHCPSAYWRLVTNLHCLLNGPNFDEESAKMAVSRMHNVDGTVGGHWTKEDTDKLAMQHGIEHKCDFYYAMNMLHSDLSAIFGNDVTMYVKVAKALYFDDPDAPKGKLFLQWIATAFEKK